MFFCLYYTCCLIDTAIFSREPLDIPVDKLHLILQMSAIFNAFSAICLFIPCNFYEKSFIFSNVFLLFLFSVFITVYKSTVIKIALLKKLQLYLSAKTSISHFHTLFEIHVLFKPALVTHKSITS